MTDPALQRRWQAVAELDDLEATGARQFTLHDEGRRIEGFVIRWQGTLYAYRNSCPHTGVELNWSGDQFFDLEGRFVQCSMHGALFEPPSGHCIHGPCQGQALASLPVWVQGATIYVGWAPSRGGGAPLHSP